jgi:hypothetical protein
MLANLNPQSGFGHMHIAFLAGRVVEYVGAGNLITDIITLVQTPTIVRDYESAAKFLRKKATI